MSTFVHVDDVFKAHDAGDGVPNGRTRRSLSLATPSESEVAQVIHGPIEKWSVPLCNKKFLEVCDQRSLQKSTADEINDRPLPQRQSPVGSYAKASRVNHCRANYRSAWGNEIAANHRSTGSKAANSEDAADDPTLLPCTTSQ